MLSLSLGFRWLAITLRDKGISRHLRSNQANKLELTDSSVLGKSLILHRKVEKSYCCLPSFPPPSEVNHLAVWIFANHIHGRSPYFVPDSQLQNVSECCYAWERQPCQPQIGKLLITCGSWTESLICGILYLYSIISITYSCYTWKTYVETENDDENIFISAAKKLTTYRFKCIKNKN